MRRALCGLVVLAFAGSAEAARPDPASDCGSLMGLGFSGRTCRVADQLPRRAVPDRHVIDPAMLLKQGLIR